MNQRHVHTAQERHERRLTNESGGSVGSDDQTRLRDILGERLRFETLVARLSAKFIHLPAEQIDSQIEDGLRELVEYLGIDRSSLGQFSEDGREFWVTHSYTMPGFKPLPRMNVAPLWPWYTAQVRAGKALMFTRLPDELPPEAEAESEYCRKHGLQSHMIVPCMVANTVIGGLGVGSFSRPRQWPDRLVANLQLVGEIFANALGRKRAELLLREKEARFRVMSDAAPVMIWMSGPDKLCTYFNKPWLDFTGQPLARQMGDGWTEGVHPGDLQHCLEIYVGAFEARQDFRMEYRLRRFDGEYRWVLDTGVPRFDADGTFEGYIGSCIDITDRKRVAEEVQELRDQLARVGRFMTLGELVASIAHEVNQPLCAVISNAQTVERMLGSDSSDPAEVREAVHDIVSDGQRASAILARIRGMLQKSAVQHVSVDLNTLIHEVCAVLRSQATRRGVTVKLELADGLPAVRGDSVQLQQVVLNFLTNAMDAMNDIAPDFREVTIRSSVDASGTVTVEVQDAGCGFTDDMPEQLFKALYTTKPGSIGMGLAICKSIIDSHGGRIGASRNANRGATFEFSLAKIPDGEA